MSIDLRLDDLHRRLQEGDPFDLEALLATLTAIMLGECASSVPPALRGMPAVHRLAPPLLPASARLGLSRLSLAQDGRSVDVATAIAFADGVVIYGSSETSIATHNVSAVDARAAIFAAASRSLARPDPTGRVAAFVPSHPHFKVSYVATQVESATNFAILAASGYSRAAVRAAQRSLDTSHRGAKGADGGRLRHPNIGQLAAMSFSGACAPKKSMNLAFAHALTYATSTVANFGHPAAMDAEGKPVAGLALAQRLRMGHSTLVDFDATASQAPPGSQTFWLGGHSEDAARAPVVRLFADLVNGINPDGIQFDATLRGRRMIIHVENNLAVSTPMLLHVQDCPNQATIASRRAAPRPALSP